MIKILKKNIKNWLCYDKVLVYPIITHKYEKNYRIDYLLNISDNNYLSIDFFENAHKCKVDCDFKKEQNLIYSIIHNSDNKYKKVLFFCIFWETKLFNEKYFTKFVKTIYNKIEEYTVKEFGVLLASINILIIKLFQKVYMILMKMKIILL